MAPASLGRFLRALTAPLGLAALLELAPETAPAQPLVPRSVVAAGGQQSTTGVYEVRATCGQAFAGPASGGAVEIRAGFWPGTATTTVSVPGDGNDGSGPVPLAFQLHSPRPNPLQATTTIAFDLPRATAVRLAVYDVRGARVKTLVNGLEPAGARQAVWDGRSDRGERAPAGMYYFRLESHAFRATRSLSLIR